MNPSLLSKTVCISWRACGSTDGVALGAVDVEAVVRLRLLGDVETAEVVACELEED